MGAEVRIRHLFPAALFVVIVAGGAFSAWSYVELSGMRGDGLLLALAMVGVLAGETIIALPLVLQVAGQPRYSPWTGLVLVTAWLLGPGAVLSWGTWEAAHPVMYGIAAIPLALVLLILRVLWFRTAPAG